MALHYAIKRGDEIARKALDLRSVRFRRCRRLSVGRVGVTVDEREETNFREASVAREKRQAGFVDDRSGMVVADAQGKRSQHLDEELLDERVGKPIAQGPRPNR